jgi:hypothetical protein
MIVNFKTRGISRDACKLTRTPILIIKKKMNSYRRYPSMSELADIYHDRSLICQDKRLLCTRGLS